MTDSASSLTAISVRVGQGSVFSIEAHHWPEGATSRDAPDIFGDFWPPRGCVVSELPGNSEIPERSFTVDLLSVESLLRFESDFGLYVAEKLDGYIAVHSALIVIGEAVVIVPGVSHRGKSTLAVAAMGAGHTVLSDEYTLISEDTGTVRGWSRPLRQRKPDGTITRVPIPANDDDYVPTHVIDLEFEAQSTVPLKLEELSPGDVAFSLLANTVCAQSRPEQSLRAVAAVSRQVQGFAGTRGEATDALVGLARLFGQTAK